MGTVDGCQATPAPAPRLDAAADRAEPRRGLRTGGGRYAGIGELCTCHRNSPIGGIVRLAEEGLLTSVTALGDMVRNARDDEAGEAGHMAGVNQMMRDVKLVHCHRNSG